MEELENDSTIFDPIEKFSFQREKEKFFKELSSSIKEFSFASPNSEDFHKKLLAIIDKFFIFSCWYDLSCINPVDFLKKYDAYLSDEEVVCAYFSLNDYDAALQYIEFNYERIKRGLKKTFIAFASLDDDGEFCAPPEIEYKILINEHYGLNFDDFNIHIIPEGYDERKLLYLLYKYFYDDVNFFFMSKQRIEETDKLYGLFHSMEWTYLKEVLKDFYNKKDYKNFMYIVNKYIRNSIILSDLINISSPPFNDMRFFFEAYRDDIRLDNVYLPTFDLNTTRVLLEYEKSLRESINPSSKCPEAFISNDFYAALKYLKTLPKKERIQTNTYKHSFNLFFEYIKGHSKFDVSEHRYMFERLFNRIIEGNSLIKLLSLENIESIFHYYKTGELVNLDNKVVNLDDVKSYNTKQYKEIRELFYSQNMAILFYDEHHFSENAIKILRFFGYDLAKKYRFLDIPKPTLITISKHHFKSDEAKTYFRKIMDNDIKTLKNNISEIGRILSIFDYLYDNNYPNITLSKLVKRIKSFEYVLLPNNYNIKDNLALLDNVSKGEPLNEKLNGITLYNEYRLRTSSSIPSVLGEYSGLAYETVDMHSPEILSNGIGSYLHSNGEVASSCLTPAGKAASCMAHGATSPHGRFFKVTIKGKIVAYSWMWRAGNTLCFDNIEVTDEIKKQRIDEFTIIDLYRKASKEIIEISKEQEKNPIEVILLGKNKLDVIQNPFNNLKRTSTQIKPNNSENLYLKDSEGGEYILIGDESIINTSEVEPIYKYERKGVQEFSFYDEETLSKSINSIYFDYCIFTNEKYKRKKPQYTHGFIGEDWYIGYFKDGTYDFYYRNNNPDTYAEASKYLNMNIDLSVDVPIIKGTYEKLEYLLSLSSYIYNGSEVLEYLKSINEYLNTISTRDYFHTPGGLKNLGKILYDGAITSSSYGNHSGGYGSNGKHFICVAEMNSNLYKSLKSQEGFIIDENICAFDSAFQTNLDFKNSRYPIRPSGGPGEKQVLDYIPLSKVKAIRILTNPFNIGVIAHIEEETGTDIPLVLGDEYKVLDRNEIKRLIKLK